MELEELRAKKIQLEKQVFELLAQFYQDTDVMPNSILIESQFANEIGGNKTMLLSGVRISMNVFN